MTAKRFKAIGENIWQGNEVWCVAGGKHCADVIATAMNELIEENEQLKSALKELKEIGDYQADRIKELFDENEQLKKQLHYCKSFVVNNNGKDVQRIFFKSLEDL